MKTSVRSVDGRLFMNGEKMFVRLNGEYAPALLVAAIDEDAPAENGHPALSMWMVPRTAKGVEAVPESKIGQEMLPFAHIRFDNVELDELWRLQGPAKGFPQLFSFFEYGRVFACATALGEAQAAMDDAVEWARERTAFGTPVSNFQQVQEMLTDMEVKLTNMRHMVYKAAWEFDHGVHERLTVALMKRYVPRAATEVASDAMQILGGRGYTDPASAFLRFGKIAAASKSPRAPIRSWSTSRRLLRCASMRKLRCSRLLRLILIDCEGSASSPRFFWVSFSRTVHQLQAHNVKNWDRKLSNLLIFVGQLSPILIVLGSEM